MVPLHCLVVSVVLILEWLGIPSLHTGGTPGVLGNSEQPGVYSLHISFYIMKMESLTILECLCN